MIRNSELLSPYKIGHNVISYSHSGIYQCFHTQCFEHSGFLWCIRWTVRDGETYLNEVLGVHKTGSVVNFINRLLWQKVTTFCQRSLFIKFTTHSVLWTPRTSFKSVSLSISCCLSSTPHHTCHILNSLQSLSVIVTPKCLLYWQIFYHFIFFFWAIFRQML